MGRFLQYLQLRNEQNWKRKVLSSEDFIETLWEMVKIRSSRRHQADGNGSSKDLCAT